MLLNILFRVIRRTADDLSVTARRDAGVLFLAGVPLIVPYHFEQLSSMLGEVPTARFLLVAFARSLSESGVLAVLS